LKFAPRIFSKLKSEARPEKLNAKGPTLWAPLKGRVSGNIDARSNSVGHNLQDRKLILLEEDMDESIRTLKDILESPLGLAKVLICLSFGGSV